MNNFFIGNNKVIKEKQEAIGQFVLIDNEKYYQIKNYDSMLPFFISLASDSNHWMYISSTGALTAGRKNPDFALFPYYTDDKINESSENTGSKTIFHVRKNGKTYLWEPFSERYKGVYVIERSISKSTIGNKLIFAEKNIDLGLTFSYGWMNADDFGWIKKSWLINNTHEKVEISLIDGLQNILPSGIDRLTQNTFSTLVDAYKKAELIEKSCLALFRMESILADRAEPSESLRVNIVWSLGLEKVDYLLSSNQLNDFRNGQKVTLENEAKGVRGAFFTCSELVLEASEIKSWYFVAEINQDSAQVNNLLKFIETTKDIAEILEQNIIKGTKALQSIVEQADGIQETAEENDSTRHFSNVLFNCMRGGIYNKDYTIYTEMFNKHIKHFNLKIWEKHKNFLTSLPVSIDYAVLDKLIDLQNDANLYRLFQEYLPLTFSRRHGDPSRPWNLFDINIKDNSGNKLLSYQGNWRDIFQNWEALSLSFPGYINGIIAKFLNATTADGYNPYKVTSEGIDWEVIEPENPWSNIGYWGDHQIIYLLKLMEVSRNHFPECLESWLDKEMFAFANVPYRLKSYDKIVENPKDSITFDDNLHRFIEKLELTYGADAKLVLNQQGEVKLVTFTEKILATLLAKLSNFIPEAGIWMNTLRPEWNDANNALVGSGASMVTLYYMRRFVDFIQKLYNNSTPEFYSISEEIQCFFKEINTTFINSKSFISKGFDNKKRKEIVDKLGNAGSKYRDKIYSGYSGTKKTIEKNELNDFFSLILQFIDQSILVNKRTDNMYHAYNLVSFSDDSISIRNLYEMLEGQVAVLSSGKLSAMETIDLLSALRNSSLYRPDQNSYILYPNKRLPLFLDKNIILEKQIEKIPFLVQLLKNGDTSIINKDKKGQFHFNADFKNVGFLAVALTRLKTDSIIEINEKEQLEVEQLYEKIFDHQSFTGRSGTFYKYEGLGSIYWHMVSKLLLSIGESISRATAQHIEPETINQLKRYYTDVKCGIGAHKSPAEYGSFPFDPYSHTPMMAGVQQPGMTGQVKEDIISRFFELGITVRNGQLVIIPIILKQEEFIQPNVGKQLKYTTPYLTFSYCSIPFVYLLDDKSGIDICYDNGETETINGYSLNIEQSRSVFNRDKKIKMIKVHFNN